MFCPKCGAQNSDGVKFCVSCGATFFSDNNTSAGPIPSQVPPSYQYPPVSQYPENKKSKAPVIAAISIMAVLLITVIVLLCILLTSDNNGSGSNTDKSDRREDSESKSADKDSSKDKDSDSVSKKGARSPEDALDNLFDALNSTDRDAALLALHPMYKSALLSKDADFIYEMFCELASEDMYLLFVETLDIPVQDEDVKEELEGLNFYCYDYEITDQVNATADILEELNELLESAHDEFNGSSNFSDWQADSCIFYEINCHISVYGEEDYEEFIVALAEVNGAWYVVALDF